MELQTEFSCCEGEHFYAIEDWIAGITGSTARKAQIAWDNLQKNGLEFIKVQKFPHTGLSNKTYRKNHTDEDGLKLIAQSLRVTRTRMELDNIQAYLINPSVFKNRRNRIKKRNRFAVKSRYAMRLSGSCGKYTVIILKQKFALLWVMPTS